MEDIYGALDKEFVDYICDLHPGALMTQEEIDSNKNAFIQAFFPEDTQAVAFPCGMVCNKHTALSWCLHHHSTNETPDLQEVGRISVDRSESNIMSLPLDRRKTTLIMFYKQHCKKVIK